MKSQHFSEESCLDYLTGDLPAEEKASFDGHLRDCSDCQSRVEQYGEILRYGLPSLAGDVTEDPANIDLPWSLKEGERRLYAAIGNEAGSPAAYDSVSCHSESVRLTAKEAPRNILSRASLRVTLAVAASAILAAALGISIYRLGVKRGLLESRIGRQSQIHLETLKAPTDRLVKEREAVQAILSQRETLISELRTQLKEERKQTETLEGSLQSANLQAEEHSSQTSQISSQRDELARKLEEEQAVLAAAQKRIDALQQAERNDAVRVVSLENQIQEMSELAKNREGTIGEQQRLLAADRDIRDLMGARDLYIAEVYDVAGNGKKTKPYGRVFLTKGKSLVFYAYDLDQQPGLKSASTFQAWGLRGPDRNTALNLGVMYVDNSTNKRWVLQFDDPKALEEINAVFVTVEPNGGSRVPSSQQVLFAYLREEPNHP